VIHTTPSAYNGYGVEVTNSVVYLEEKDDKKTLQLQSDIGKRNEGRHVKLSHVCIQDHTYSLE
jgi:hypothetical protein